jgi:hypothetical protein
MESYALRLKNKNRKDMFNTYETENSSSSNLTEPELDSDLQSTNNDDDFDSEIDDAFEENSDYAAINDISSTTATDVWRRLIDVVSDMAY